jgi:hypothetical protein
MPSCVVKQSLWLLAIVVVAVAAVDSQAEVALDGPGKEVYPTTSEFTTTNT